jgi:hypothetical protein
MRVGGTINNPLSSPESPIGTRKGTINALGDDNLGLLSPSHTSDRKKKVEKARVTRIYRPHRPPALNKLIQAPPHLLQSKSSVSARWSGRACQRLLRAQRSLAKG